MSDNTIRNLCVVMERRTLTNRWVSHQWNVVGLLPDMGESEPRCLLSDSKTEQWVYPALQLRLHADEADNYFLNLSAPDPRLFVILRDVDDRPEPAFLSVSYGEAARLLDAGENVEGVTLPEELWHWVAAFAKTHYQAPEPRHEKRFARTQAAQRGVS